ncbi:MAG: hypothetical protein WDW36_006267 [Sanguina aurantia]
MELLKMLAGGNQGPSGTSDGQVMKRTLGLTPAGTPQPPRPVDVREEERQQAHPTSALRGMPPWSVIVDDRVDVWDSHSKPFVHQALSHHARHAGHLSQPPAPHTRGVLPAAAHAVLWPSAATTVSSHAAGPKRQHGREGEAGTTPSTASTDLAGSKRRSEMHCGRTRRTSGGSRLSGRGSGDDMRRHIQELADDVGVQVALRGRDAARAASAHAQLRAQHAEQVRAVTSEFASVRGRLEGEVVLARRRVREMEEHGGRVVDGHLDQVLEECVRLREAAALAEVVRVARAGEHEAAGEANRLLRATVEEQERAALVDKSRISSRNAMLKRERAAHSRALQRSASTRHAEHAQLEEERDSLRRKKLAAALEQLAEANIASKVDDVDLFCRPITKEWHRWHPSCGGEPVIQPILMSEATWNEESEEEEPARHDAVNRQAGSHHARMESGRVDGQHIELK